MEQETSFDVLENITTFEQKVAKRKKHQKLSLISRVVFFVIIWAFLLSYFLSPLGHTKINHVEGNYYLTKQEILSMAGVSSRSLLLSLNEAELTSTLEANPRVKDVDVNWTPFYIDVSLNEIVPIAKTSDDKFILTNGLLLDSYKETYPDYEIDTENIHAPKALFAFLDNRPTIIERFLETLKVISKEHFENLDYIDITRSSGEESTPLYYSIYIKTNDNTYLRVRATIGIMEDVFDSQILSALLKDYLQFGELKSNEEETFSYRSAICSLDKSTIKCARE